MRCLRSVVVAAAVLAGVVACTNDFDRFEGEDGQGSEPLAGADAGQPTDAATPAQDSSSGSGDHDAEVDGGSCTDAAACVTAMTSCRSSCSQTQTKCFDDCGNDNKCRKDCRAANDSCSSGCQTTCRSCAASCASLCN